MNESHVIAVSLVIAEHAVNRETVSVLQTDRIDNDHVRHVGEEYGIGAGIMLQKIPVNNQRLSFGLESLVLTLIFVMEGNSGIAQS